MKKYTYICSIIKNNMKQTTRNQVIKVLRYSMPFEAAAMAYFDKPALCVIFISIAILAFAYDYES